MLQRRLLGRHLEERERLLEEMHARQVGRPSAHHLGLRWTVRALREVDQGGLVAVERLAQGKHGQQLAEPRAVPRRGRVRTPVRLLEPAVELPPEVPVVLVCHELLELRHELRGVRVGRELDGDLLAEAVEVQGDVVVVRWFGRAIRERVPVGGGALQGQADAGVGAVA